MIRVTLLLGRRIGVDLLWAHLGGIALLALVLAVEGADLPWTALLAEWTHRLPTLWAQASAVLTLVGTSLALFRLRRDGVLLALGSFGVSPRASLAVALVLGLLVGGGATSADRHAPASEAVWVRAEGGWFRDGIAVPDAPGTAVTPSLPRDPPRWTPALTGAAAGLAGAALGLWTGGLATLVTAVVLLVGNTVILGLVGRSALPEATLWIPALGLVAAVLTLTALAPLFPRRWG